MQIIYGVNPVKETLLVNKIDVEKIILAKGRKGRDIKEILEIAAHRNITIEYSDRESINKIADSRTHQGIICVCKDYMYASLDEIVAHCHKSLNDGLIIILDGITDPHNLGSIIRTGHCFGVNGIVIPENRAAQVTPTVVKVSAGATQHVLIARVVNISRTLEYLKDRGFWIYGADVSADQDIHSLDYKRHTGLVLGSEEKGIRPLVMKKCDSLFSIRMFGNIDSLNVSVTAGIIIYEMSRQRKNL
ncbi:MAG: 23S rRNA (guanosine(2251)-2'-O)-methyltransferase RlmB [Deltaproteobacteria bacterium]|nr:23S rRNA (guanosine(2251)-2'-O)-methyltransferase RlmB [Deltaproteobacteria bacterium]